jgi:hypothetical protein
MSLGYALRGRQVMDTKPDMGREQVTSMAERQ